MLIIPLIGCSTLGYYVDAINGHAEIISRAEPVDEVLASDTTRPGVKAALRNLQQARNFASTSLLLPDNGSYRSYADIGREYAVWNVIATEQYSITPKQWCYPVAGCVSYKGFHHKQVAEALANQLRQQGYDVYVAGARAYSTLGWFDDPLLNTMLYKDESLRVELLFHELAHQKIYVQDDTAFNEAFATFVAQEGVRRWFEYTHNNKAWQSYQVSVQRRQALNTLLRDTRQQLADLYRQPLDPSTMEQRKRSIFVTLKANYVKLKQGWQNDDRYDHWMAQDLNNAHLALVGTYYDQVPGFQAMLNQANGNIAVFYELVEALSAKPVTVGGTRVSGIVR